MYLRDTMHCVAVEHNEMGGCRTRVSRGETIKLSGLERVCLVGTQSNQVGVEPMCLVGTQSNQVGVERVCLVGTQSN